MAEKDIEEAHYKHSEVDEEELPKLEESRRQSEC